MVKAELANDIIIDKMPYAAKKDFFNYIVILAIINGNDKILSELPTSLLTNAGFSSKYIQKLIEKDGDIGRIRRGIYQISPSIIEKLFDFGASLQETGAEDLAVKVFDGCYKLDPTYISVKCFNTFCNLIANKQYDEATELYKSLCAGKYSFVTDFRYYLFLLDKVTKLPLQLERLLKGFTANGMPIYNQIEIAEDDARFTPEERQARNNIRAAVANHDCRIIREQYSNTLSGNTPQDKVEAKILRYIVNEEGVFTETIGNNLESALSENVKEFLEEKYQELKESKIILLGPLSDSYISKIAEEIHCFPDMLIEEINLNGQKEVLLKNRPPFDNNFDGIKNTLKNLYTYANKNDTRKLYYRLLEHAKSASKISSQEYAMLGCIEKNFRNTSRAITCYLLASAFAPETEIATTHLQMAYYIAKDLKPLEEFLPEEAIPIKAQTNKKLIKVQSPDS